MKTITNVAALFLLLLAGGCTRSMSVGREAEPIIGGTTDSGDPAVVLVRASQQGGYSLCTGAIVSPHVVMTAAHCTDPSEIGSGNTFDVFIGTDLNGAEGQDPAKWLAVQETHYNPSFDGNNLDNGQDVGVVILSAATSIAPLALDRTAFSSALIGKSVRIVGYGNDDGQSGTGAGTRRQASTPLSSYDDNFITFGDSQHDTCQGDSGGPAFMTIGGAEVIVGVTSFGNYGCTGGAYDTRVDTVAAPFVDPYIQKFDPASAAPPDMASAPPADLLPAPSGNGGAPDLASSGNGKGNGGGADLAGHLNLNGGGGAGDANGRASGGCTLAGRANGGGGYLLALALVALIRRRARARY